jgi:hypothetical protein
VPPESRKKSMEFTLLDPDKPIVWPRWAKRDCIILDETFIIRLSRFSLSLSLFLPVVSTKRTILSQKRIHVSTFHLICVNRRYHVLMMSRSSMLWFLLPRFLRRL